MHGVPPPRCLIDPCNQGSRVEVSGERGATPSGSTKLRTKSTGRLLLFHPEDDEYLTRLVCFVRRQLEVYPLQVGGAALPSASSDDDDGDGGDGDVDGDGDISKPRRAGIRCIHCAPPEPVPGASPTDAANVFHRPPRAGATSLPTSTRLVYQSVRNWQRKHFMKCPDIPPDVMEEYQRLKNMKGGGGIASPASRETRDGRKIKKDSGAYWERSCRRMGLVDTDIGLCLRGEVLNGTWTEEMGKAAMATENSVIVSVKPSTQALLPSKTKVDKERPVAASATGQPDIESSAEGSASHSFKIAASASLDPAVNGPLPVPRQQHQDAAWAKPHRQVSDSGASSSECNPLASRSITGGNNRSRHAVMPEIRLGPNPVTTGRPPSEGVKPTEASRLDGPSSVAPGSLSLEALLNKIEMALSAVHAVIEMREFAPPTSPSRGGTDHHEEPNYRNVGGGNGIGNADLAYVGMELYELFAGRPPFIQKEEETLSRGSKKCDEAGDEYTAHQRLKRDKRSSEQRFVPLRELGLPLILCDLVSGLLERGVGSIASSYNSVAEVEQDLVLILNNPGKYLLTDLSGEFRISQHSLYGREEEMKKLLEAFDWTTNPAAPTNGMVLISGYAGTGKSSLVAAVQDKLVEKGACFVSGKFDAMRQMRPLSAVVSAFDDFCALLACDEDRSDKIRDAIATAMGAEGGVLADMIPNLRKVMSVSENFVTSSSNIGGREAMQRLMFLFRMLLRATCSKTHPVVLFLDDLQWADEVSLELVHALITDVQLSGLLFVGSYRDNEVFPDNPLTTWISVLRGSGRVNIRSVAIGNLDGSSVNSFVSDVLGMLPRMTRDLSGAVLHKTGGNALFVAQFLASLRDEGLLSFSLTTRQWHWDIEKITTKNIADNVVELMREKILSLAPEVRSALRVAAGFGAQCHQDILHIIDRASEDVASTNVALDIAVSEGLMMKVGPSYRFSHDQIQRAAYLLISEPEREAFHLRLGRSLWGSCSTDELESYLFVVVDQLHRGSSLLNNHDEKINLAQLSLMAGEKASSMSGFLPASAYFKAGIQLLVDDDWISHWELCFDLYNSCAEMEHILGDFDGMKQHLHEALKRARSLEEGLRPNFCLVQSLGAQGHVIEAINTAVPVLSRLGEAFPTVLSKAAVQQEVVATHQLLCEKSEEVISKLDPMENPSKREAMKLLNLLIYYVFTEKKEYFPVFASRMVSLSLKYGVCSDSAMGFCSYGMLLCILLGDYAGGFRFGQIGLRLMERFQVREHLAKIYVVVFSVINPWKDPIQAALPCLKEAVDVGLSTGDTESAMLAAHAYGGMALVTGHSLVLLVEEMSRYAKQMMECKQHHTYTINKPSRQAALYLVGDDGSEIVEGSLFDDGEGDSASIYSNALLLFHRMWLQYLFAEYENAVITSEALHKATGTNKSGGFPSVCNGTLYSGLAAIALARKSGKMQNIDKIQSSMAQMKVWAASAPWNCQHKLELMNAEYAYLEGDLVGAAQAFDASIELAKKHSFIHEQALALERAGIFFLESGDHDKASNYFTKAHLSYSQWGAYRKAAHVQQQYL